jgi:beta-lactamase superfamily II metal-dependent hydrolase
MEGLNCYDGIITVLGPSEALYKSGLLESDKTPKSYIEDGFEDYVPTKYTEEDYVKDKPIEWYDDEKTAAVNQTSLVIALALGNFKVLFTGDAGKEAINNALDYYEKNGGKASDFTIVQLPHHGSRKNIDPTILGRLGTPEYIISCPPDGEGEGHPSRRLMNKILELNPQAKIYVTKKVNFIFHKDVPVSNCTTQKPATAASKIDGR